MDDYFDKDYKIVLIENPGYDNEADIRIGIAKKMMTTIRDKIWQQEIQL